MTFPFTHNHESHLTALLENSSSSVNKQCATEDNLRHSACLQYLWRKGMRYQAGWDKKEEETPVGK